MSARSALLRALRDDLDEARLVRACEDGLVTARQAADVLKFIRLSKERRPKTNVMFAVQVGGRYVGEIEFDGTDWVGRRYGAGFPNGCSFATEAQALEFVARAGVGS